tara:strand:+ start:414 stop:716 length:303 start_codon:yes stop_codon:yes gene_type:complete
VKNYILCLKEESDEMNNKGSSFSTLNNVYEQLPFFCCYNSLLDAKHQKDIARYIYCEKTNTQSYPGSYGEQPSIWLEKFFLIEGAMNLRNKKLSEKQKNA